MKTLRLLAFSIFYSCALVIHNSTRAQKCVTSIVEGVLSITIGIPFDAHLHLRQDEMLSLILPYTVAQFGGALVMPNTKRKIKTTADGAWYTLEIANRLSEGANFKAVLSCYLTNATDPDDLEKGFRSGLWRSAKLYPLGMTTNSSEGVSDIYAMYHVFKRMEELDMTLCIHGERMKHPHTNVDLDPFGETEDEFLENELTWIMENFPKLPIILEHVSTKKQAIFILRHKRLRCTITPQHVIWSKTAYLQKHGVRKWDLCKMCFPTLKSAEDVEWLWILIQLAPDRVALGTDSAPHPDQDKGDVHEGCCAGCLSSPTALEFYVQAFAKRDLLHLFEQFATNGWKFYDLIQPTGSIVLKKTPTKIPYRIEGYGLCVTPLENGETIEWTLEKPVNYPRIETSFSKHSS